jgi:acyl-CoA synthetase (AMP-forming)/AMP-acid ligase II
MGFNQADSATQANSVTAANTHAPNDHAPNDPNDKDVHSFKEIHQDTHWDHKIPPSFQQTQQSEFRDWIDLISARAAQFPHKVLYQFLQSDQVIAKLTYQELEQQAQAIAAHLQGMQMQGQRALLIYPPGLDFIVAFYACLYAGVVAVPAYPPRRNQSMTRLEAIISDADAAVVLTCASLWEGLQTRIEEHPLLRAIPWLPTDVIDLAQANQWERPDVDGQTLAFLQYTSGSTGNPKGVMVSHRNLLHNAEIISQGFGVSPALQGVIWLPPYHDMGLIGGILQPLYAGGTVALMSPMDFLQKPLRWLSAISRFQGTVSGGPNFAYELCLQKITPEQRQTLDLSSWQVAFTGAEPIRAETLVQFSQTFAECGFRPEAFYPCYGMAETTLMVTGGTKLTPSKVLALDSAALEHHQVCPTDAQHLSSRHFVSCGATFLGQRLEIVHPEGLYRCPTGQVGEIWVAGNSIAKGYWNRTLETTKSFGAYLQEPCLSSIESGPFFRTGDLGFVHDGELYITGRIKDVIIIRGQNHYPHDIEFTVQQAHPALMTNGGAAFTLELRGKEQLVIVQEVERTYLRKLEPQLVLKAIRQAVTSQHGLDLHAVVLVKPGTIPKTSSGKIRRRACQAAFNNDQLEIIDDWRQHPEEALPFRQLKSDVVATLARLAR